MYQPSLSDLSSDDIAIASLMYSSFPPAAIKSCFTSRLSFTAGTTSRVNPMPSISA